MTAEPEHYRVVGDYESPYPDSMSFLKGELVKVGQEFKGFGPRKKSIILADSTKSTELIKNQSPFRSRTHKFG